MYVGVCTWVCVYVRVHLCACVRAHARVCVCVLHERRDKVMSSDGVGFLASLSRPTGA